VRIVAIRALDLVLDDRVMRRLQNGVADLLMALATNVRLVGPKRGREGRYSHRSRRIVDVVAIRAGDIVSCVRPDVPERQVAVARVAHQADGGFLGPSRRPARQWSLRLGLSRILEVLARVAMAGLAHRALRIVLGAMRRQENRLVGLLMAARANGDCGLRRLRLGLRRRWGLRIRSAGQDRRGHERKDARHATNRSAGSAEFGGALRDARPSRRITAAAVHFCHTAPPKATLARLCRFPQAHEPRLSLCTAQALRRRNAP